MKTIVIIGASSGIGYQCARMFIEKGWRVAVAARREHLLQPLKELAPDRVNTYRIDITDSDSAQTLQQILDNEADADVIFNVAGIGKQNSMLDSNIEEATLSTNVIGFTRITDQAFKYFSTRKSGGHIAAITSIAGTKGLGAAASYSASKRFQNTYLDALDQLAHIRNLNIAFTDIRPGFVDTDLLSDEHHYPMMLDAGKVAKTIVKSIEKRKRTVVIDKKYALLTFFWRLIPQSIWVRLKIKN